MKFIGKIAISSFAALSFSMHTAALASAGPAAIQVTCPGVKMDGVCAALANALQAEAPDHRVVIRSQADPAITAHLSVEFNAGIYTDHILSGQLSWTTPKGQTQASPVVDLTVMDAKISREMIKEYATQLVRTSNLPL